MTPRYKHDCKSCVPFGRINRYDLYHCRLHVERDQPVLVARWSSKREDYMCGTRLTLDGIFFEFSAAFAST